MQTVRWSQLNCPEEPRAVMVCGIGSVNVKQSHIDLVAAGDFGDDPSFTLIEHTAAKDDVRCFTLNKIIPE